MKKIEGKRSDAPDEKQSYIIDCCNRFAYAQRYAEHLCCIAPKQAQILLITAEYDQSTMQGPPFAVLEDEVQALYSHQYQIERLHHENSLDVSDAFRQRGMQRMDEKVYLLTPR